MREDSIKDNTLLLQSRADQSRAKQSITIYSAEDNTQRQADRQTEMYSETCSETCSRTCSALAKPGLTNINRCLFPRPYLRRMFSKAV